MNVPYFDTIQVRRTFVSISFSSNNTSYYLRIPFLLTPLMLNKIVCYSDQTFRSARPWTTSNLFHLLKILWENSHLIQVNVKLTSHCEPQSKSPNMMGNGFTTQVCTYFSQIIKN